MNIKTDLKVTGDTTLSKLASVGFVKTSGTGLVSTGTITSTNLPMAVDTDQEAGTSTTTLVSPGVQKYHPGAAKFWVKCGVSGNKIVSYNVDSVNDSGTGIISVIIDVDFSGGDWVAVSTILDSAYQHGGVQDYDQTAGYVQCRCYSIAHGLQDPETWHVAGFGAQ